MSLLDYLRCLRAVGLFELVGPPDNKQHVSGSAGFFRSSHHSHAFSTEWDGRDLDLAVQTFALPLQLVSAEVEAARIPFEDFKHLLLGLALRIEPNPFLSIVHRVGTFVEHLLERYRHHSVRLELP